MTTIVFAPNWLGDAVMALPALADIRRHVRSEALAVAARRSVAGVFELVPGVDRVVTLTGGGTLGAIRHFGADVRALAEVGAEVAILLPNSMHSALLARQAGIPERWAYARDFRRWLLTRKARRPKGKVHQAEYYRQLVRAFGIDSGPLRARLEIPLDLRRASYDLLRSSGWNGNDALVGVAPGAAYGRAKQWPPRYFSELASRLASSDGARSVLVGSRADYRVACEIEREAGKMVINLAGRTTLRELFGVMGLCRVFVSNDSGAMHAAAAVGIPVVAMFGPTEEHATSPLEVEPVEGEAATPHALLTSPTWCRPCMLRECPLDHACMTDIAPERVHREVRARLSAGGLKPGT